MLYKISVRPDNYVEVSDPEMDPMSNEKFFEIAHRKIIGSRERSVKLIANCLSISPESLYNRLHGRTPFEVEEARGLIGAVKDIELANYVIDNSGLHAVPKANSSPSFTENLHGSAIKALLDTSDILRLTELSLKDGKLDHVERANILKHVVDAERAIASLKALLN